MHSIWTFSVAAALLLVGGAAAQDPLARKELDRRLDAALYDVSRAGTELFNRAGNEEGCYRVYEGGLRVALPLLDHHPEVKARAGEALKRAATEPPPQRAFTLRSAIEDIRKAVKPKTAAPTPAAPTPAAPTPAPVAKTLWERLGGADAVKAVVHDLVDASAKDPKVNFTRNGQFKVDVPKLEKLLVEFISSTTGGPLKYTGRDMKTTHAGMKITDAEFNAMAAHLVAVLKKHKVNQKEIDELVAIVGTTKKDIVEQK